MSPNDDSTDATNPSEPRPATPAQPSPSPLNESLNGFARFRPELPNVPWEIGSMLGVDAMRSQPPAQPVQPRPPAEASGNGTPQEGGGAK